jgi:hypothetical protein
MVRYLIWSALKVFQEAKVKRRKLRTRPSRRSNLVPNLDTMESPEPPLVVPIAVPGASLEESASTSTATKLLSWSTEDARTGGVALGCEDGSIYCSFLIALGNLWIVILVQKSYQTKPRPYRDRRKLRVRQHQQRCCGHHRQILLMAPPPIVSLRYCMGPFFPQNRRFRPRCPKSKSKRPRTMSITMTNPRNSKAC